MDVRQIAWARGNGDLYGVAHNQKGEGLGNVRISEQGQKYFIVAYNFRGGQCVETSPVVLGLEKAKEIASSKLVSLLEAA